MTHDTTTATAPATLTEKELFAIFVKLTIAKRNTYGSLKHNTLVSEYTPEEHLQEPGGYGELEEATHHLFNYLVDDERPEEAMRELIDSLEAYTEQLKMVWRDFYPFKEAHVLEPMLDEPDQTNDPEGWKAWSDAWDEHDNNPRFRAPALKEGEAA
jgi:hypothetical protein